ncbi:MAG: hypothetical protein ACRDS0_32350 [Pseudonocardiaceae bacterium]
MSLIYSSTLRRVENGLSAGWCGGLQGVDAGLRWRRLNEPGTFPQVAVSAPAANSRVIAGGEGRRRGSGQYYRYGPAAQSQA